MSDDLVELTETGRQRALELKGTGPRHETIVALYENGRMTIEDLEGELGLDNDKVIMVVNSLVKKGYLRQIV